MDVMAGGMGEDIIKRQYRYSFGGKLILALIIHTVISGCALAPGMRSPDTTAASSNDTSNDVSVYSIRDILSQAPVETRPEQIFSTKPVVGNYRIGPRDVLNIVVWNQPKLSTTSVAGDNTVLPGFTVEADGSFYYPFAGKVQAAGKTTDQVRSELVQRLAKVVKTPQISVTVASFGSKRIYVLGEVEKPRMIPLQGYPMSVMEAIALAGGLTETASSSRAYLLRNGKRIEIELGKMLKDGDISQNFTLQDGDVLQIPDNSSEKVYVLGAVRQPRSVTILGGRMSLSEALMEGGGMDPQAADAKNVYVIRGEGKRPKIYHLDMEQVDALILGERFPLQSRDVVYVATSGISNWNRVLNLLLPNIQSLFYIDALSRR